MIKENVIITNNDIRKMRMTNAIYNDRKINSIENIGCVMKIIVQKKFTCCNEWIKHYFETGNTRKDNYNFGRTKQEFENIILRYLDILNENFPNEGFTYEDSKKQLYQRIFYDTWNGLKKEISIIEELEKLYPDYIFEKCDGDKDIIYAVDIEVKRKDKSLVSALQVKPISYMYKKQQYIKDAHQINVEKNKKYIEKNDAPVLYIYYNDEKTIVNTSDFFKLKKMVS